MMAIEYSDSTIIKTVGGVQVMSDSLDPAAGEVRYSTPTNPTAPVIPVAPTGMTITSVTPTVLTDGAPTTITITGSGFLDEPLGNYASLKAAFDDENAYANLVASGVAPNGGSSLDSVTATTVVVTHDWSSLAAGVYDLILWSGGAVYARLPAALTRP